MVASSLELLLQQLRQSSVVVFDIAKSHPSAVVWPGAFAAIIIVVLLLVVDVYKTFSIPTIKVEEPGRSAVT
jgi:hypothetical protein